MRYIGLSSIMTAVVFFALGAGLFVWWHAIAEYRLMLKPHSAQVVEFVRTTTDLEHLRALTQLIIRTGDETTQKANETIDLALNMIAGLSILCGVFSLMGWAYARKAYILGSGSSMPTWLRWL